MRAVAGDEGEAPRLLDELGKEGRLRGTEAVLSLTLPLLEQALLAHDQGSVAPLVGVDDLRMSEGCVWFERGNVEPPTLQEARVRAVLAGPRGAARAREKGATDASTSDLNVGAPGEPIVRPVYLSGYVSWEHELGHHDALTDIYVLGLVMASVALDRDLGDRDALVEFVRRRAELSRDARLHPRVARLITRMTEIDRHARAQDLRGIVRALRAHRATSPEVADGDPLEGVPERGVPRRRAVYRRLRDRLFASSEARVRAAAFRPTVDLSLASVPLAVDAAELDPQALFTWGSRAVAELLRGKAVPLGRVLRFDEHPYLAAALLGLCRSTLAGETEIVASTLRLALCFLRMNERADVSDPSAGAPLLLLPVTLVRRPGVRDDFVLTAESDRAEVTPWLREHLLARYDVRLPETFDVASAGARAVDDFHAAVVAAIDAAEAPVTLEAHQRPRLGRLLAQARQRVEAHRRSAHEGDTRARASLAYSYVRGQMSPLGVQLFSRLVLPPAAPRDARREADGASDLGADGRSRAWALDVTHVTLGGFADPSMPLMRDYASLLESDQASPSLDALFGAGGAATEARPAAALPEERLDVVPSDPTQQAAVALARAGASFVLSAPPGTGASQTITNLVADYVARGKRVLVVSEKRAALDAVGRRLRAQGLGPLACVVHDPRADAKAILEDLKEGYERWIAEPPTLLGEDARRARAAAYGAVLTRARRYRALMQATPAGSDASVRTLLDRALELDRVEPVRIPRDALPSHEELLACADDLTALEAGLRAAGRDPRFGRHPARLLSDAVLRAEDPVARVRREARDLIDALSAVLASPLAQVGQITRLSELVERCAFIASLRPLIEARALRLLDAEGAPARKLRALMDDLERREENTRRATRASAGWTSPLPADDVGSALVHARRFEGSLLARVLGWLSPTFWRLRRVLRASFDFEARAVPPAWSEVLVGLKSRYDAEAAVLAVRERGRRELGVDDLEATWALLEQARGPCDANPELKEWLVGQESDYDARVVARIADRARELDARLGRLLRGKDDLALFVLRADLERLLGEVGDLEAVAAPLRRLLAREPGRVASLVRARPVSFAQIERAVCDASVDAALRAHAPDALSGEDWDALGASAREAAAELRRATGAALVERAHHRFHEAVGPEGEPVSDAVRARSDAYAAGRRELERELGRFTRHPSLRALAAGPAGVVLRDLKPVWLMSPLAVADTLPLEATFDAVIFDEASQLPLEHAVPAAHRGAQLIVVGDAMQLSPSSSGSEADAEGGGELDAPGLFAIAARALPSVALGWHYRCRDEALVAFSNRVFYGGALHTAPPVARAAARTADATNATDADATVLDRPLSVHRLASPFVARRNRGEARYVAELCRSLLRRAGEQSLGVVALSAAQRAEIEEALRALGDEDGEFRALLDAAREREEGGERVGLFVKTVDHLQGDARDIVLVSVGFAPDPEGAMPRDLGCVQQAGGDRRVNVLASSARRHLAVVTSIDSAAITDLANDGAACLRSFLRYAEAVSAGQVADEALPDDPAPARAADDDASPLRRSLEGALRERGYEVEVVGGGAFRGMLRVGRAGEPRYRLGVLVDDAAESARPVDEVLEHRSQVLADAGWTTLTVLPTDWWADRERVLLRLLSALGDETRDPPSRT